MPRQERYERAREFVQVCKGLWDSWAEDAFIEDKAILEAQQLMIDAGEPVPMVNIVADKALMQYRRLVDELIAAEN